MSKRIYIPAILLAALAALPPLARAGERVTLRNGFVEQCDHHAEVEGRIRLYLSAGEDNYIEFEPAEIASFEQIPDPPAPVSPAPAAKPQSQKTLTAGDLREMLTAPARSTTWMWICWPASSKPRATATPAR